MPNGALNRRTGAPSVYCTIGTRFDGKFENKPTNILGAEGFAAKPATAVAACIECQRQQRAQQTAPGVPTGNRRMTSLQPYSLVLASHPRAFTIMPVCIKGAVRSHPA